MTTDRDQGYNGHRNYETWLVSLWLDGNYTGEGTYLEVLDIAQQARADAAPVWVLADSLQNYVGESLGGDDGVGGLIGDLLNAALSEVDWDSLAESKLAEVAEES